MTVRMIRSAGSRLVLVTVGLLVVGTACSSSSSSKPSATPSAAQPTPSASASGGSPSPSGTAVASTVTVTEKEYSLTLSQHQFTPGRYTFVADNAGTVQHALVISGPGVPVTQVPTLSPGQKGQFTVTLRSGSYELWCPIDGHKGLGMDAHIQVGGGSSASGSSTMGGGGSASTGASPSGGGGGGGGY